MVEINPVLFKTFDRDTSKLRKVPVYNSKTEFSTKTDIFSKTKDFVKTNKEPIALISLLLLGAGITSAVLKNKPVSVLLEGKKILSKSKGLIEKAGQIQNDAQKELSAVSELINQSADKGFCNVSDESGNIVRKFVNKNDLFLMQEYAGGKILRETGFNPETSSVRFILNDVSHKSSTDVKAKKLYVFGGRKLTSYYENCSGNLFDSVTANLKTKKNYIFENGKFLIFADNLKINGEKENFGNRFVFVDDKLRTYENGLKSDATKSKLKKQFNFTDDGKVSEYKEKIKLSYDSASKEMTDTAKVHYVLNENEKLVKKND